MATTEKKPKPMDTLQELIRAKKCPLALTISPSLEYIPGFILQQCSEAEADPAAAAAMAYWEFCLPILERAAEIVPSVVFKVSAFEAIGWRGSKVMAELMSKAKELGLYVIADGVKSEVSAFTGYVRSAYLGQSSFETYTCDSVTISGYLGSEGVKPYLDYCVENDKTVFVLVKSANGSTREFQELITGDRLTYMVVGDQNARLAQKTVGKWGFSLVGAVFGPAYSRNMAEVRKRYPNTFFLIPEFGGQGGKIFDCAAGFNKFGHGALVCCQAVMTGAWKTYEKDERTYVDAAIDELLRMKADVRSLVQVL